MKSLKTIFLSLIICANSLQVFSQNIDIPGYVHLNPYLENPAALANTDSMELNLGNYYLQDIYNTPIGLSTDFLMTPPNKNSSYMIRYSFISDFEKHKNHEAILGYAHKHTFRKNTTLSMGIFLSGADYYIDYNTNFYTDFLYHNTPIDKLKGNLLSVTPGLIFSVKNLRIGITSTLCYFDSYQFNYINQEKKQEKEENPYWLNGSGMLSYKFNLSSKLALSPYFRISINHYKSNGLLSQSYDWNIDMGSTLQVNDIIKSGIGFKRFAVTSDKLYVFSSFKTLRFLELSVLGYYHLSQLSVSPPISFLGQVSFHL